MSQLFLLVAVAFAVMAAPAWADPSDFSNSGPGGTTMTDAGTGLEWLDLDQTAGMTVNQVLASSLVTVDGWSYANTSQVNAMFLSAGFATTNNVNAPVNDPAAALLLNLMGVTLLPNTNFDQGRGWAYHSTNPINGDFYYRPNYHEGPLGAGAAVISLGSFNQDLVDNNSGHFLIRQATSTPVPEPAAALLLALGFFAVRRRRA